MTAPYNSSVKKLRVARPSIKRTSELNEESQGWAVSYADFLMVLLSFFIIFFSIDKPERTSFINNLLVQENKAKEEKPKLALPQGGKAVAGITEHNERLPEAVLTLSKSLNGFYTEQKSTDRVIISFDDNIYKLGSFKLNKKELTNLHRLLVKLEPYMNKVRITFVGHTDETKRFKRGNRYIGNNFDLSSLRATKALQQAVKLGFSPKQMYAQGMAEHERATRTLSLIITPEGEKP